MTNPTTQAYLPEFGLEIFNPASHSQSLQQTPDSINQSDSTKPQEIQTNREQNIMNGLELINKYYEDM
jgi:hypothetical protein